MALAPKDWTTGTVAGDEKFTSADQVRQRVAAIRSNRGLKSMPEYDNYWVRQITSGKSSIGDARDALTAKARERIAAAQKKNTAAKPKPKPKKPKGNPVLDLTPAQLRQLVQGRRSASTDFKTTLANLEAQRGRGIASFRTRMAELARQFGQQRDQGMRQLGGRGQASQPMFAGNFLRDLRNDEASVAGQTELEKAQLLADIKQREQQARAQRSGRLADLDALEAAFRSDVDRIMGGV